MVAMVSVPTKPATEAPAITPVGVDGGGVVSSIEVTVLDTPEVVLDVPLVEVEAELTGAVVVAVGVVGLYKHSPANQES